VLPSKGSGQWLLIIVFLVKLSDRITGTGGSKKS